MVSNTLKENLDDLKEIIAENKPYSLSIIDDYGLDDTRYSGDPRFLSTMILKHLLEAGYSEHEVNPWKERST